MYYDFSDPYLAEYIVNFLVDNDMLNAPYEFEMSMLEFVTIIYPNEFANYLSECGVDSSLYVRSD